MPGGPSGEKDSGSESKPERESRPEREPSRERRPSSGRSGMRPVGRRIARRRRPPSDGDRPKGGMITKGSRRSSPKFGARRDPGGKNLTKAGRRRRARSLARRRRRMGRTGRMRRR